MHFQEGNNAGYGEDAATGVVASGRGQSHREMVAITHGRGNVSTAVVWDQINSGIDWRARVTRLMCGTTMGEWCTEPDGHPEGTA